MGVKDFWEHEHVFTCADAIQLRGVITAWGSMRQYEDRRMERINRLMVGNTSTHAFNETFVAHDYSDIGPVVYYL